MIPATLSRQVCDTVACLGSDADGAFPDEGSAFTIVTSKLRQLQIVERLDDLRVPPGNRLEALKGDRAGQFGIRINGRYRICFVWTAAGAENVEIVGYHG